MTRKFGCVRDTFDPRDFTFQPKFRIFNLPKITDLRDKMPPVYDQLTLGSCTSQAIGASLQFQRMKQGLEGFMPSRLFHYYNERAAEGTTDVDNGAMIRTGIKVLARQGICREESWPYEVSHFKAKPEKSCYEEAEKFQSLEYERVNQKEFDLLSVLADGHPFVLGIKIYESFMDYEVSATGTVMMPKPKERCLGGHAVLAAGYDRDKQVFICRNSWGTNWATAMRGYFTLPFEYVLSPQLASDMWKITLVE